MPSSSLPPRPGAEHNPAWYHNLRAHPDEVSVEIGGRTIPVRPRVVEGAERAELWQLVNDNYNGYETYQDRVPGRLIPVVVLEPAVGADPGLSALELEAGAQLTARRIAPGRPACSRA